MTENNPAARNGKTRRKAPGKITADYLRNAGLHYLQRFSSSSGNFRRVMLRKIDRSCAAHPDQGREESLRLLDDLISGFLRSGLLDDASYVRGAVASLRRRGLSARAIEARMAVKGIPPGHVRKALEASRAETGQDDLCAALRLMRRKKLGAFGTVAEDRSMAALGRAGFDYETARAALSMDHDTAENMLR